MKSRVSNQEILEGWEKVKEGATLNEVGKQLGYSHSAAAFGRRVKKLISEEEYKTRIKYGKRRSVDERRLHTEKIFELFYLGFSVAEIVEGLKQRYHLQLTYTQVVRDLHKFHPDNAVFRTLMSNGLGGGRRLTLTDIKRAQKLLRISPIATVSNITGFSRHRLRWLAEENTSKLYRVNTQLYGQIGEWLLARYLSYKFPTERWHILQCIEGTALAPDFWIEEEWWDSKMKRATQSTFDDDYSKQFSQYLEHIPKGIVVYWFGCIAKPDHGIKLFSGQDLLKEELPEDLEKDVKAYLKGEFLELTRRWFGLLNDR